MAKRFYGGITAGILLLTGEVCMGCGWTPSPPTDLGLVQAIEAVNSGPEQGPYSRVSFWERQLNQGFRLTAVGGSDLWTRSAQ